MDSLLTTGTLLMLVGYVGYYLRTIPQMIWFRLRGYLVTVVQLDETHQSLYWLDRYLANLSNGTIRTFRIIKGLKEDVPYQIIPGFGTHWFIYKRRLIVVNRNRESREGGGFHDTLNMFIWSRNTQLISDLLDEGCEASRVDDKTVRGYINDGDYWSEFDIQSRPIESVFLPNDTINKTLAIIEEFKNKRDWYIERGIPYRLNILLEGPPGTGKTSLVHAIASHFKCHLYSFRPSITYDRGLDTWRNIAKDSIVVWEDFDIIMSQVDSNNTNGIDDSCKSKFKTAALQHLDGLESPQGMIMFLTANNPDKLDPTIIRPGRIDIRISFDFLKKPEIIAFLSHFYRLPNVDWSGIAEYIECDRWVMAKLQAECLKYKDHTELLDKYGRYANVA